MIGKRLFAMFLALALTGTAVYADEKRDGTAKDITSSINLVGGVDGSSNRAFKTDPSGILRSTEEYPVEYQVQRQSLVTGFRVAAGSITAPIIYPLGNSVVVYPFHHKGIFFDRETGSMGVHLYIFSSYDDVDFNPVSTTSGWGGQGSAVDTLHTYIDATASSIFIPLPDAYVGRYIALFGFADSTADSSAVISLTFEGRMD